MLKNAPTLAIVAVHTEENEPPKVLKPKISFISFGSAQGLAEVLVLESLARGDLLVAAGQILDMRHSTKPT